jgi:hypothetical protein
VHPAKPTVGLRTTRADEMWHIDTTVIRLLDGTRAYLHAVIDNFSRRILAWRVAETFAPVNSVAVLVEAGRGATPSATTPVVLADAGVENVNAEVDALIDTGVLRRLAAALSWAVSDADRGVTLARRGFRGALGPRKMRTERRPRCTSSLSEGWRGFGFGLSRRNVHSFKSLCSTIGNSPPTRVSRVACFRGMETRT